MRIAIDLNTRLSSIPAGMGTQAATKTRIEYASETAIQGGKLNERGVFDRTTGAFTGSSPFFVGSENSASWHMF